MKKYAAIALAGAFLVSAAAWAGTLSTVAASGTRIGNESVEPTYGTDRRGEYVIHYTVPAAGVTGAVDLVDWEIPKGTILLEDAVIEVQTALLPTNGTAAIAVGGVTILAAGSTLEATGIDAAVASPGITTTDDKPYITVSGTTATQGVFTVYLPVVGGNDR